MSSAEVEIDDSVREFLAFRARKRSAGKPLGSQTALGVTLLLLLLATIAAFAYGVGSSLGIL